MNLGFPISAVDLFCGVGGLTHGLVKRGIEVTHGVDIDPQCSFPYEANNNAKFVECDVSNLTSANLSSFFPKRRIRLLAGCAPCQPFSTYSQKSRLGREDNKWKLAAQFGRIVSEMNPELVTMENVPQLADHSVFNEFLQSLSGYQIDHQIVQCEKYGVPQTRKRLVLVASRLGKVKLLTPEEFHYPPQTVRSAISHLPQIGAGESDANDPLHMAPRLSALNLKRIKASKPGGTWRDWNKSLLAPCHRRASGITYPSVYGRMEWDQAAPTITTQCFGFGNGRFGHPIQNRAISLREAAILQTFPEDYQFARSSETIRFNVMGRLIGNAVPVRLGELIAESFKRHIDDLNIPKRRSN